MTLQEMLWVLLYATLMYSSQIVTEQVGDKILVGTGHLLMARAMSEIMTSFLVMAGSAIACLLKLWFLSYDWVIQTCRVIFGQSQVPVTRKSVQPMLNLHSNILSPKSVF